MRTFSEKQLIDRFKDQNTFSRKELYDFHLGFEPGLKEGTFGWRIYKLNKKNLIRSIGKGIYTLSFKPEYQPIVSKKLKRFAKSLSKFSDLKYCIWDTSWLNEFSRHQVGVFFNILEVEKEMLESVFYNIKDNTTKNIFLNPDEKIVELYVSEKNDSTILKPLISRSPLREVTDKKLKINIPALEKILVDVYCDKHIFHFYVGSELKNIFEYALEHYSLDFTRLLGYANRRGKESEIREFCMTNFSYFVRDILK